MEVFLIVVHIMGAKIVPLHDDARLKSVFATQAACLRQIPAVREAIGRWSISVSKIECQKREVSK